MTIFKKGDIVQVIGETSIYKVNNTSSDRWLGLIKPNGVKVGYSRNRLKKVCIKKNPELFI